MYPGYYTLRKNIANLVFMTLFFEQIYPTVGLYCSGLYIAIVISNHKSFINH